MKKWLLLLVLILVIGLLSVYIFIPSTINISVITAAKATRDGTFRMISSKEQWHKWWNYHADKTQVTGDSAFIDNDYHYDLAEAGFDNAVVSILHDGENISSNISLLQFKTDSIGIMWQCSLPATANPFERIKQYFRAISIEKNITAVSTRLKDFIEKGENIYGIKISEGRVRDTFLVTEKKMFMQQPSMNDVYAMINDLQLYAAKKNCRQTDAPMLNISHESDQYRAMVALPIDKEITTEPPVSFVKMINGNFMVTKVQGGLGTVQNALQQMQLYFDDYNKTSMAITFQYLVTDRIKEIDTTKWITEIYAPVL